MNKPTLILLPGMPLDAALWEHQTRHLGEVAEARVVETSDYDTLSGIARAVIEAAPERFLLAGLSLGGYVAMEVMRQAPERVAKLALIGTNARADTPEQAEKMFATLQQLIRSGALRGIAENYGMKAAF